MSLNVLVWLRRTTYLDYLVIYDVPSTFKSGSYLLFSSEQHHSSGWKMEESGVVMVVETRGIWKQPPTESLFGKF